MKTIYQLVAILSLMSAARAEVVEVYSCESRSGRIDWESSDDKDATTFFSFHHLGRIVGTINLSNFSLKAFVKRGLANREAVAQDPFFGPGVNYLLKDSQGDFYIVFFEYKKGHKSFPGRRMAINNAVVVGDNTKVFLGSAYEGGSPHDKNILDQLRELTKKQAEQAATGKPATRPELKSQDKQKAQPEWEGRPR